MRRYFAMLIAALVAVITIGAASPTGVGASGGSGSATIQDVSVSCADPATGAYTVTWVAHVTGLSRHNTPTVWSLAGQTTSVNNPIFVTTSYVRYQMSWYNREPVITVAARIGFSQPILNDRASVPGYCATT